MNFSGMFDGIFLALLFIGALLGLAFAGLIWLAVYLFHHIHIGWIA